MEIIEDEIKSTKYKGILNIPFLNKNLSISVIVEVKKETSRTPERLIFREDAIELFNILEVEVPLEVAESTNEYIPERDVRGSLFTEWMKFDNEYVDIFMNAIFLVGFVPLIDEVTGYQLVRGATELRDMFAEKYNASMAEYRLNREEGV